MRTAWNAPPFQRPREKFLALGPSHMAMEELLAILLRTGVKGQSAISLASDIVQSFDDGVYGLNRMTVDNLTKIKGIGRDKAVTLCAALEMGKMCIRDRTKIYSIGRPRRSWSS